VARRLLLALPILLALCGVGRATPGVIETQIAARGNGAPRRLTVILPPGYGAHGRRYPVLYLMDGQNLLSHPFYPGGWRADTGLAEAVRSGASEPMIIVGVHAQDRTHELTPVPDPKHGGGGAAQMVEHLVDDVIPYVEQHFAARTGSRDRAIGGSSLGGLFALHTLLTRKDVFSRGLVLSPSVWWAHRAILADVARSATIGQQRVVLYNGGDQDGRANAERLRDLLAHKGLVFEQSLFHWTEPDAGHDEPSWARFLPRGLGKLFPAAP